MTRSICRFDSKLCDILRGVSTEREREAIRRPSDHVDLVEVDQLARDLVEVVQLARDLVDVVQHLAAWVV